MKEINEKTNINIACEYFQSNLLEVINNSKLPIGVAYFVIKGVFKEVQDSYYATLNDNAIAEEFDGTQDNTDLTIQQKEVSNDSIRN